MIVASYSLVNTVMTEQPEQLLHMDYRASTVIKMNHYFLLHHHPSMFLLSHLKQRLLRLLPLPQQQWRHHGLSGRLFLSWVLPLIFRRQIHLNKS
jgi:hypothetical protein